MRRASAMALRFFLLTMLGIGCCAKENRIWYDWPPTVAMEKWTEALPIGNGKFGAMVYGHPIHERLQLNEDSVWSGGKMSRHNQDAAKNLPLIRSLLASGQIKEAEKLTALALTSAPVSMRNYEPLGDMELFVQGNTKYQNFQRWLDLDTAIAGVKFDIDGTTFTRESFASAPDDVIVTSFNSSLPGSLSFNVHLTRQRSLGGLNSAYDKAYGTKGNTVVMLGSNGGKDGISFAAAVSVLVSGGSVQTIGDNIIVTNANQATIFVSADTSVRSSNPESSVLDRLAAAQGKSFQDLRNRHVKDHQSLYNRVNLRIGSQDKSNVATHVRWDSVKAGNPDQGLFTLLFNYGRYMLIASSRPGSLPANLQGLWNQDYDPAWGSKYTININTQMNYWPAEVTNLAELHLPLFDHIERIRKTGVETAKIMYNATGWVSHHNTDIWGDSAPQDLWLPASYWTMTGGWLCIHILEHYWFTGDVNFLKEKMPTVLESIDFYLDTLQPHGELLVTNPSVSPENTYRLPNGQQGSMAIGPAVDTQILSELMNGVMRAESSYKSRTGGASLVDAAMLSRLNQTVAKLPPMKLGRFGNIQEWIEDYDEVEPGHRHISHLFGLYPGSSITDKTTSLFQAAKATVTRRLQNGGAGTGWSRVWVLAFYARLGDGAAFAQNVLEFVKRSTYVNLFDAHPPFQADGNYGYTAAMAEALVQSHWGDGTVSVLPALPVSWVEGEVSGLVARGGFIVDLVWAQGAIAKVTVNSTIGGPLKIRYPGSSSNGTTRLRHRSSNAHSHVRRKVDADDSVIVSSASGNATALEIDTVAGKVYVWDFL